MLLIALLLARGDTTATPSRGVAGDYWQQQVAYEITASLDEPSGVLTGHVRIHYRNQSPDTLRDFYVHQYLNAFRPGSRWSAVDEAEGRQRFQRLKDPDYAFERITASRLQGAARTPDYPFATDSTVAHWALPRALAPGDSMVVEIDWQARPSTLPRRQGRRGRRFDFAQWYPKVVVYDRYGWEAHALYPAGEFYGEFATYDVTLDLPADQVIGATGVPVEGDPGWEKGKADRNLVIDYQRDYYHTPRATRECGGGAGATAAGRKCVRFHAENVHHFAFSLNPQYVYEEGRYGDVVVRVLYQPQDSQSWGHGVAVGRTVTALAWLDTLYGHFDWPQLTNVHRIEGGGTEFPMMVMDGDADLGLIIHEVGHNYTMGILANNEWREGYLDEGFTSFQTGWYFENHGAGPAYESIEPFVLGLDLDGWSQPVSMVSEQYRDFPTYNDMIYTKGQLFYEQLRYVVGDATMRRILRTYYARWQLKHVDERAFRDVCEEVSHQDLGWLFAQWLHGTSLIDYRLERVVRRQEPSGTWRTDVAIRRLGRGAMPVEIGDRDTVYTRASGQPELEWVEFTSARKPGRLILDPRGRTHDWNMLNNAEPKGLFRDRARHEHRFDDPTHEVTRRDRKVDAWRPLVWANDVGGLTLASQIDGNYLGRLFRSSNVFSVGTGKQATQRYGFYGHATSAGPYFPRTSTSTSAWWTEGRAGIGLQLDHALRQRLVDAADPHVGITMFWMATTNVDYLDRRLWDDAGTIEVGPWWSTTVSHGRSSFRARLDVRGGLVYRYPGTGFSSATRYDVSAYGRINGEASVRAPFWLGTTLGLRFYAGADIGQEDPVKQRRIYLAGADPYETFPKPLLRTRGAWFVRQGFYYQAPGGANLRGFDPALGGRWATSVNVEDSKPVLQRSSGFLRQLAIEGFVDAGIVDTEAVPAAKARDRFTTLWDVGMGLVTRQRVRDLSWTMRFEIPLIVNRWDFAADKRSGLTQVAWRWLVSLEPSF